MFPDAIYFGFFLLSQICIGVTVNSSLFVVFVYSFLTQPHLRRPIDSIMIHLTMVNIFTIIVTLIPYIKVSFGVRYFLDDVGCRVMLYLYRVTRGVSMCTTSLLSTFQAIAISPFNSMWASLKSKLSASIIPSFLIFWLINFLIFIHVLKTVKVTGNFTAVGRGYFHAYCRSVRMTNSSGMHLLSGMLSHDLLFLGLMLWSSLYMASLLHTHHRRVRHVHSPSAQTAPEIKATRNILFLTSCFVFFYCLNNILTLYSFYTHKKILSLEAISVMLSSCYPTICPFFLMKHNKVFSQFFSFTVMRIFHPRSIFSG